MGDTFMKSVKSRSWFVVQKQVMAYQARNLKKFLSTYSESARVIDLERGIVLAAGRKSIRKIYSKLFASSPNLLVKILKRISLKNVVVDLEEIRGLWGSRRKTTAIAIYQLNRNKIQVVWLKKIEAPKKLFTSETFKYPLSRLL